LLLLPVLLLLLPVLLLLLPVLLPPTSPWPLPVLLL
jgi:hypothetical protein